MPECIILKPLKKPFDVAAIRHRILEHPGILADPLDEAQFLVVEDQRAHAHVLERRQASAKNSIAAGVIEVGEEMLLFAYDWIGPEDLAIVRDLAEWVVAEYEPRIFSDVVGDDWTERCADGLDPMFPPELPARST